MNLTGVLNILNMIQSGLRFLATRGIPRDRAIALLGKADRENRDVSTQEAQTELDASAADLDDTGELIDDTFES